MFPRPLITSVLLLIVLDIGILFQGKGFTSLVSGQATKSTISCEPIQWNVAAVPGYCSLFNSVCVDHGSRIILHEERYQVENVRRENTPGLPNILWNLPMRVNSFPDALSGWQPDYNILVRPVSKVEPTLPLRHPDWSDCTLPIIIMGDYIYNYKTFVVKVLTDVDSMMRAGKLAPNSDATLVLATPAGLALEPYHAVLLSPYSRRPLITMGELGRRGMEGLPAAWTGEGVRVHCFKKLVACKADQRSGSTPHTAAANVVSHLGSSLPTDPLDFGSVGLLSDPSLLRVVIEVRSTPWRSLRDGEELLRACEEADRQGFSVGPFKRIICRALPVSYSEPGTPSATADCGPSEHSAAGFRRSLAAVRSANLFVALTGSSGAHAFFMAGEGPTANGAAAGGSGFVEVRPCGWGSEFAGLADAAPDTINLHLERGDDAIRFFAYNLEDASQCAPPDFAPALAAVGGDLKLEQTAHNFQPRSPPRYRPAELLKRDQHVTLRPGPLLAMIRHAASLLSDKGAYRTARGAGRLHGYGVAEGLLLGPLGIKDAAERAKRGPPELIRA